MKKIVLIVAAFLLAVASLSAEDTIFLKTGEKLAVKIFRIDDDNIYYRHVGEEIDYQISKQKVREIAFQNGRKEMLSPDLDQKIKFKINDPKREYVIVNDDYNVEDKLYIINETEENAILSIYGQHYESHDIVPLELNARIPADGKPHRVAKRIEKGKLDHYSAFKFVIEGEQSCSFNSAISDDNLYVSLFQTETNTKVYTKSNEYKTDSTQVIEFKCPACGSFIVKHLNEDISVQVYLFDSDGNIIMDTGLLNAKKQSYKFDFQKVGAKAKVFVNGMATLSVKERRSNKHILIVK